jgi:vacuolar-type H+-ATPase subunit H
MNAKRKVFLGAGAGLLGVGGLGVAAVVGLGVLVVVGLLALPSLLKGPVTRKVDALLAEHVDADVKLGGLELSFLSSFPRVGVRVTGVEIQNKAPFQGVTLAKIGELSVGLDVWSVVTGSTFQVQSIELVQPELHVVIDEQGRMNTDIVKGDDTATPQPEEQTSSGFGLRLRDLDLQDASVRFEDRSQGGSKVLLSDIDLGAHGSFSDEVSHLAVKGSLGKVNVKSGGMVLLKEAKTQLDATMDYTASTGAVAFEDSRLQINAFPVAFHGSMLPQGDDYVVDVAFETKESAFSSLLSLVPAAFSESFSGLSSAGTIAFSGAAKGRYSTDGTYPGLNLVLAARDARFQYPGLPAVENIDLDVAVDHPEGDLDQTVIDVKKIGFRTADTPFSGRTRISHPMTDPELDADFRGRVDVAALRAALPSMADSIPASGQLDMDLAVAGRASDFQAPNPDRIKASGTVKAIDLRPPTEDWPADLRLASMEMSFSPEKVDVRDLLVKYGKSDLAASGTINNVVGYALGAGDLTGALQVSSKYLDLRPFQGDSDAAPEQEPEEGAEPEDGVIAPVPEGVDLTVTGTFDRVITEMFSVSNAVGQLEVADQEVRLKDVKADAFGGEVKLSGKYAATTTESADLDINIDSYKLDLNKMLRTFKTLRDLAPVLSDAMGRIDAGISLVTRLKKDGTPVIEELSSRGLLGASNLTVKPASMKKVGDQLGNDGYSTLELGGSKIAFSLEKGAFNMQPTQVKLGGLAATMSGSAGVLKKTVDFRFDTKIPTKSLAGTPVLAAAKQAFGPKIDVAVRLQGPWDSPRVSVSIDGFDSVGEVVEGVVEAVVGASASELIAQAERQGDALIAAARTSAANLLTEAQKAADTLLAEADKQGKKLIREAKNPVAEVAAKEAVKVLDKEAQKSADKVLAEAKKAGDKLIAEAETKKEALVAEAQGKVSGGSSSAAGGDKAKSGKAGKAGKAD